MTWSQSLRILLGFLAVMFAALAGLVIPGASLTILRVVVVVGGMIVVPMALGETLFDVVDKFLDTRWVKDKKLAYGWHAIYALVWGGTCLAIGAQLARYIVSDDFLGLGGLLQYLRPIDATPWLFGLPTYAWQIAFWPFAAAVIGYLFELAGQVFITRIRRR